jgi:molybdate transport repressor ModE-like protein
MSFDLVDLRLFAAVAETGSITAGAAQAGLALPSASARVRGMEAALGVPLLERGRRGVRPTPAGEDLAHHAREVLARMEQLRGALADHAGGRLRGRVRLLANTAALEAHLPDRIGPWLRDHPGIELAIEERPSQAIPAALAQGQAEIGLLSALVGAAGLETRPFALDRLVLAIPPGHPLAGRAGIALAEMLEEDVVALPADTALGAHLDRRAARLGRRFRARLRLPGTEALCRLVATGAGLAILPERVALRVGGVAVVPLTDPWASRPLLVGTRDAAALPGPARRLFEHLAAG